MAVWPYNTKAWRDLRQAKLAANPCCEVCERRGRVVLAVAVDHIVAIAKGGAAFPPLSGLMSLCLPCHSWKTNHEDRPDRKRKLGSPYKGAAVDGGSLDPNDDWSASAPACGPNSGKAGGFAGPGSVGFGPARESKKELVADCNQSKESDRWV